MNGRIGRLKEPTRNAAVVIVRAATDRSPPSRYYAGRPALIAPWMLRFLPRRIIEALLTSAFALPADA
jgi:hypothetical protein